MTDTRRNQLRSIMETAWALHREGDRTFADALRGAWRFIRGMAKTATAFRARTRGARHVMFSKSLIGSPMQRATSTQRYAAAADGQAARVTSRLGV